MFAIKSRFSGRSSSSGIRKSNRSSTKSTSSRIPSESITPDSTRDCSRSTWSSLYRGKFLLRKALIWFSISPVACISILRFPARRATIAPHSPRQPQLLLTGFTRLWPFAEAPIVRQMCGIVGVYTRDEAAVPRDVLLAMAGELRHRGPDGTGLYLDGGLGVAASRLAIVDLDLGDQPLSDDEGRFWVVQNGEIYNYVELTRELEELGHRLATRCDTEVLANAYAEWG